MSPAHAPTATCVSDSQCASGFFCETAINVCQMCLSCEGLKREAPATPSLCIKSVADCGPCLLGLMVDHRGEFDVTHAPCVPAVKSDADVSLPPYIWAIIGLLLLGLVFAMIIILVYVLRRKELFRISTRTWLRSSGAPLATAPEPPPPYNPYSSVPHRPDSPNAVYDSLKNEDWSLFPARRSPRLHAADRQNARPFNPPNYVRVDPQSPASGLEEQDSEEYPPIHDEDTAPHAWTPDTSANEDTGSPSGGEAAALPESSRAPPGLPALLAAARDTTLVVPPPKKMKTQDNNSNNIGGNTARGAPPDEFEARAAPRPGIVLNIVQINNTKL